MRHRKRFLRPARKLYPYAPDLVGLLQKEIRNLRTREQNRTPRFYQDIPYRLADNAFGKQDPKKSRWVSESHCRYETVTVSKGNSSGHASR